MALLTISKAAKTVGKPRSTIYKHIKNGTLSATKDSAGNRRIDTSELARVYGYYKPDTEPTVASNTDVDIVILESKIQALEAQNRLLERELEAAKDRENKLMGLLETRLLEPPKGKRRKSKKKKGR